jgi:4'-phosphopantetheinyl transferase
MRNRLTEDDAHVWIADLDAPAPRRVRELAACLSTEEQARCAALATVAGQRRFTLGRAALRAVLAHYTARPAAALHLVRDARGKPRLVPDDGLHFSLSHSRGLAVIAVAAAAAGVDVEHERQPARLARIAHRILHPETCALLRTLTGSARIAAFLDAWTLREAHVKAVGGGLFRTPDALPFDPHLPADGEPRLLLQRDGAAEWSLARFAPAAGMRAALVVRGRLRGVRIHDTADTDRLLAREAHT